MSVRFAALPAALVGLLVLSLTFPAVPAASAATAMVRSSGSVPAVPRGSHAVGALPGTTMLSVDVVLRPRDQAALDAFADAVSTPGSPMFRQYIARGEFAEKFGPTRSAISAVRLWLSGKGLTVGTTSTDGLIIPVQGPAATMASAFGIGFERYRLPSGRVVRVPTAEPLVPADLASVLTGIVGLDDLARPTPELVRGTSNRGTGKSGGSDSASPGTNGTSQRNAQAASGPQASCAAMTDAGLSATQLAQAYSFSAVYGWGDEGQGSTIGIYELEPYLPSDVATYESCYSPPITASVSPVPVNGANPNENAGSDESALDIDMAVGMAPQATVKVYVGSDSGDDASNAEVINTYAAMVDQDFVKVISTSWGECELDLGSSQIQVEASLFAEAASQGQSVVAASGDSGSEDCFGDGTSQAQVLQVDDPASQPWVTGVGGTTLSSLGPPPTEQVWDSSVGAGGGGVSSEWTMPSWQSGPGVQNPFTASSLCPLSSGTGTRSCRESPDVSADADPENSPFAEYAGGSWTTVGGTSMGAPLWAALAALADEEAAAQPHKGPAATVGLMNPALYQAALAGTPAFNDITSGNNQLLPPYLPTDTDENPLGGGPYYPATTHYDLASGLGTPIASELVQDLGNALVAPCSSYTGSQAFVCAVYVDLLRRSPDSGGLSYWAGALASGESSAQVVYAIATSSEYRNNLVSGWYQTFLDRVADAGGLSYWMGALGSGSTDEQVIARILGSSEFYDFDCGSSPDGFVSAIYEDLLGRSPDSGGLSYWAGALASGESLAQVAYAIATSSEYRDNLVSGWYQTFLDRAVDSDGLGYWMGAFGSGSADEQVIAAILGSAEFYADATS